MNVNFKTTEAYQMEVRDLFQDRLSESVIGIDLSQSGQFNTFDEALLNFHKVSEDEHEEELKWCLHNAVLDATESFILESLQQAGLFKGDLQNGYPDSISEYLINTDDPGIYLDVNILTVRSFSIGFSYKEFCDVTTMMDKLQQCFSQSRVI